MVLHGKDSRALCRRPSKRVHFRGFTGYTQTSKLFDRPLSGVLLQTRGTAAGSLIRYLDENTANSKFKDAMAFATARVSGDANGLEILSAEKRHKDVTVDMLTRVVIELLKTKGNTRDSEKQKL